MLEKHRDTTEERAFPVPVGVVAADMQGLSIRDYFAGQALAGLCANETLMEVVLDKPRDRLAELAYSLANSVMEVRKTLG